MTELAGTLFLILLTDIVNPVLFAFMVYAVGTGRPFLNSLAMLLGHTVAYFVAGVVLAIWLESLMNRLASPEPYDFGLSLVVGVVLLWFALRSREDTGKRPADREPPLTPVGSFFFGAVVNLIGIPFAVPYVAALGEIMQADLSAAQGYATLLAYTHSPGARSRNTAGRSARSSSLDGTGRPASGNFRRRATPCWTESHHR